MSETTESQAIQDNSTRALVARLWRDWMRAHLSAIVLAAVLMAVAAALTGVFPWLIEQSINLLEEGDLEAFYVMPAAIIAIAVLKGLADYAQTVVSQSVALRIINRMQKAMFAHLMKADIASFHESATGTLMSRFTHDVGVMRDALSKSLVGLARNAFTATALIAVMFYLDWLLALIVVILLPIAGRPVLRIGRRLRRASANAQVEMGDLTANLNQAISGIRLIKSYRMEARQQERANRQFDSFYQLVMKIVKGRSRTYPILEIVGGVSVAAILAYGGWRILSGTGTLGEFVGFLTALIMAYQPIRAMGTLNASLQEGLAAVSRSFTLLDTEPGIVDHPDAKELTACTGQIAFENVDFAYEADATALRDLSFAVQPGGNVALVGPSGAGKSTVMNLIPRFYDPDSGRVTVDGMDVRELTLASLRSQIGWVSQDITLFDDTVAANIGFGRPGASRDEVIAAAKAAAAHDFITDLPSGYDTPVGENGISLSGGQRQRIAIARAMLRDAPILLLDEATSALDAEAERQVQQALSQLSKGRTTLVIAHRLATVQNADTILVLDQGKIIEAGTHSELLAKNGLYARVSKLQFREAPAAEETAPRVDSTLAAHV